MSDQLDWVSFEDHMAQLDHLIRSSVERIGVPEVAHLLGEKPSSLRNQIAGRRTLPPRTHAICHLLDPQFRQDVAGVLGERLSKPPDLTPEQALREIQAKAVAGWDRRALADVAEIVGRTRREGEPVQPVTLRAVST